MDRKCHTYKLFIWIYTQNTLIIGIRMSHLLTTTTHLPKTTINNGLYPKIAKTITYPISQDRNTYKSSRGQERNHGISSVSWVFFYLCHPFYALNLIGLEESAKGGSVVTLMEGGRGCVERGCGLGGRCRVVSCTGRGL